MATGNLKVSQRRCNVCGKMTKCERNGMIWGCGDPIMVFITVGLWCIARFIVNEAMNPWRCSECGKRA
jgi:hypothetical protein